MTKRQNVGLAVIVLSILIGAVGTAWSIYSSFAALDAAEFAGIGPVGDWIRNALVFSIGGFVGMLIGTLLLIFGRTQNTEPKRSQQGDTSQNRER